MKDRTLTPADHTHALSVDGKTIIRDFRSFADFCEWCQKPTPAHVSNPESRRNYSSHAWTLGATWEQSVELARDGWPEGRAMLADLTAKLEGVTQRLAAKPRAFHDVTGDFVDAGRFASGEPECMLAFRADKRGKARNGSRFVRIVLNMGASGAVRAEHMAKRGAAALALCDALETAGRSVEIMLVDGTRTTAGALLEYTMPIKAAGERVEIDRLAFAMVHPSTPRRLSFAAVEQESMETRGTNEICWPHAVTASQFAQNADVTVPEMLWNGDNAALVRWVMEQLKEQGALIEGAEI